MSEKISPEFDMSLNRQIKIYSHRKKQAANDAQLIMNRIALLQKEEERSRKIVDHTKAKVDQILKFREENSKRLKEVIDVVEEDKKLKGDLKQRNAKFELENRKNRLERIEKLQNQRKCDVINVKIENIQLNKLIIQEHERELHLKQLKSRQVKEMEEEARRKRELERLEFERKVKAMALAKAEQEAEEAHKAQELVHILEAKEREWIIRLQQAQHTQEKAKRDMDDILVSDSLGDPTEFLSTANIARSPPIYTKKFPKF